MEHRALAHKSSESGESKGWTGESLAKLYAECCRTREEKGIERVNRAFKVDVPPKANSQDSLADCISSIG